MAATDYTSQTPTKPAFPELLWSKPEGKRSAGKLLIVGGNANGISAPVQAFTYAEKVGIGTANVLLPDALKSIAGKIIEHGTYAPSTPSGSLSKRALADLLDASQWADATLLAGDFGRNSETAILIEAFLAKKDKETLLTKDAVDYVVSTPSMIENISQLTLVASLSQLQKFIRNSSRQPLITYEMSLPQLAHALKDISIGGNLAIITRHHDAFFVAFDGQVSVTNAEWREELWQLQIASKAAVWLAQQPQKKLESLTTAVYEAVH